jgi:RNA polymerase sigma-B factor
MGPEQAPGPDDDASGSPALSPTEREELIEANLGLANQLARRFMHRGAPYEDLVQVASVGLIKSADRYDPARGVDFEPLASRTILGDLQRHCRDGELGA